MKDYGKAIADLGPFELARMVGCGQPLDVTDGGRFLISIRDAVLSVSDEIPNRRNWEKLVDEAIDPVFGLSIPQAWAVFTDLALWEWDDQDGEAWQLDRDESPTVGAERFIGQVGNNLGNILGQEIIRAHEEAEEAALEAARVLLSVPGLADGLRRLAAEPPVFDGAAFGPLLHMWVVMKGETLTPHLFETRGELDWDMVGAAAMDELDTPED